MPEKGEQTCDTQLATGAPERRRGVARHGAVELHQLLLRLAVRAADPRAAEQARPVAARPVGREPLGLELGKPALQDRLERPDVDGRSQRVQQAPPAGGEVPDAVHERGHRARLLERALDQTAAARMAALPSVVASLWNADTCPAPK